jgi:hypothetical protein
LAGKFLAGKFLAGKFLVEKILAGKLWLENFMREKQKVPKFLTRNFSNTNKVSCYSFLFFSSKENFFLESLTTGFDEEL